MSTLAFQSIYLEKKQETKTKQKQKQKKKKTIEVANWYLLLIDLGKRYTRQLGTRPLNQHW